MAGSEVVPFQAPAPKGTTLEVAGEAWKIAYKVADTEFVPKGLRGKPEAVLACILTGHEAGLSPMRSLSLIDVVDGRPTFSAQAMRALVMRAGHEVWVEESGSTRVVICGQRAGSERVSRVTWTLDDAKRAKLDRKTNWMNYPRAMLLARATSELCRQLFPDVLAGISHSREELADGDDVDAADIYAGGPAGPAEQHADTAPGEVKARATAVTRPAPADDPAPVERPRAAAPALPGEEDDDADIIDADIIEPDDDSDRREEPETVPLPDEDYPEDPDPQIGERVVEGSAGPKLSGGQMIAMRFGERGMKSRDDRLAAVAAIIGHDVESSNDLGPDEVRAVLDYLGRTAGPLTLDAIVADLMGGDDDAATETDTGTAGRRTAVTPPEEWDRDRWNQHVKMHKSTVVKALKLAREIGARQDPPVIISAMDDLVGSSIAGELAAALAGDQ